MAIELNKRTKILAGVVAAAAVGAGAWFFFLQDFLSEPPPKPAAVKKSAPAAAAKPAADAAKPAPNAAKQAAAPKPGAKPIPTDPDKLVAEVIQSSGVIGYFQTLGREVMLRAGAETRKVDLSPADYRARVDVANRVLEPAKLTAELAANLKSSKFDDERMARFLELLRQPIAVKMAAPEMRSVTPEATKEQADSARKNPPAAARVKLVQTLDDVTHSSEVGAEMAGSLARDMVDTMLESMKKSKKSSAEAEKSVGAQLNVMRDQARAQIRSVMFVMYRKASDEELSEYVKLLDTDTGRWGSELLASAIRPLLVPRGSALGREVALLASAPATAAKEPAAPRAMAQEQEKRAEAPVPVAAAAPAAPVGYQRPGNIRDVYSRYNDVISATVMRDRAAVKELLDDGKSPDQRQSNGFTPLMIAVSNGDSEIASMLLAKGADANARVGGRSVLSMAKARGSAGGDLVRLLERNGAKD